MTDYEKTVHESMLNALKDTYRKHALEDERVGWHELSDTLCNALCNAMGDQEFVRWSEGVIKDMGYRGALDFA